MIADPRKFICEHTRVLSPPLTPEIRLHLADDATELWKLTEDELGELGLPPPYWAFAWAGGQALARYILDHPHMLANQTVLDIGAGSGLVAIAARMAGAARVYAADIDAFAIAAMRLNAETNKVAFEVTDANVIGAETSAQFILVGDLFYERELAPPLLAWLRELRVAGKTVLIGDPGRTYLPNSGLRLLHRYDVPVTRALEDAEIKRATIWELAP